MDNVSCMNTFLLSRRFVPHTAASPSIDWLEKKDPGALWVNVDEAIALEQVSTSSTAG